MQTPSSKSLILLLCALMMGVVMVLFAGGSSTTYAQDPSITPDTFASGDQFCPYFADGISSRIVVCIRNVIITAAKTFLATFLPYYTALVMAVLILSTVLFGGMMAIGALQKPPGQTFFFLFKLGGVAFFAIGFGGMIDNVFDIMDGLLGIVTNYITLSASSACSDTSHLNTIFSTNPRVDPTVWDKVDCMFMTFLGITAGTTIASGLGAVMVPLFFTSGIGLIIFAMMCLFVLTLLVSIMRAIKIYLMSVITVAFLICVSPMVIPLLLFNHTRPLFDNWLKYLANYILIPVFLFAFLSMMVAGFDALLFRGTSSLFYAIAGPASQEEHFSFHNWLKYGISGEPIVIVDGDGMSTPVYDADGNIMVSSGAIVGRNVPGTEAITLIKYRRACIEHAAEGDELHDAMKDVCTVGGDDDFTSAANYDKLTEMIRCATNPIVSDTGGNMDTESCEDVEGNKYYGFERNEEIMHFAITPNIESDKDARAKANKKCGTFDLICKGKKALGAVFNFAKSAVGVAFRAVGAIAQMVGNALKAAATLLEAPCRLTPIPGAVCAGPSKILMVAGTITHAAGTFADFSGRVLINGLLETLGDLFSGWFDVDTLDLQKLASYRCTFNDAGIVSDATPVDSEAWLDCPGPADIIIEILYIVATALVFAFLMLKWLSYVPQLGKTMVGVISVDTSLPGEEYAKRGMGKIQTGMEAMLKKSKGGGG